MRKKKRRERERGKEGVREKDSKTHKKGRQKKMNESGEKLLQEGVTIKLQRSVEDRDERLKKQMM